jgi:hypothetical protein
MMPSAFAVFKLITSSNLVGCSTGRSAGLAPLKKLVDKRVDPTIKVSIISSVGQSKPASANSLWTAAGSSEPFLQSGRNS